MHPYKLKISLRVSHPSLTADEICNGINLKAVTKWSVGEGNQDSAGNPMPRIRKNSYCLFKFNRLHGEEMAEILFAATEMLTPDREFLLQVTETGGVVELFLGCFFHANSGEELDWPLLKAIADLRIRLTFDFYPEGATRTS